jgi:WD40 repeat protein
MRLRQPGQGSPSLSRDGRRLLIGGGGREARVWDAATGQPISPPLKCIFGANRASFSPDGSHVVTVGGEAQVWDAATGQCVTLRLKDKGQPFDASFSPDSRRVVTCRAVYGANHPAEVQIWDASTGLAVTAPIKQTELVQHVSFSPDGRRILIAGWREARVWDLATGQPVTVPMKHDSMLNFPQEIPSLNNALFSPDGSLVATASHDRKVRVWDAATGQAVTLLPQLNGHVWQVSFSPDGRHLLTASGDEARVWHVASGEPVTPPLKNNAVVFTASFSCDGSRVVTAARHQARVWDAATGLPLSPPFELNSGATVVSFTPDGDNLVSASTNDLRVWDLPCDDRPTADLLELAEVLAGARLDQHGGMIPLDLDIWISTWNHLSQRYPAPLVASAEESLAWHQAEANACVDAKLWAGALLHLDHLIESDPAEAWWRAMRGNAHAELGHWAEAAADFGASLDADTNPQDPSWHLLCLAGAGKWDEHRKACAALLQHYELKANSEAANDIAWYCVRFRDGCADTARPLKLAEQAVAAARAQDSHVLNTLGAALYRAGRPADAIKKLEEGIRLTKTEGGTEDWLFLAMSHQRLGHVPEAKKWLTKAKQWIDQSKEENPDIVTWPPFWARRLELQLLQAEAEAAVGKVP